MVSGVEGRGRESGLKQAAKASTWLDVAGGLGCPG